MLPLQWLKVSLDRLDAELFCGAGADIRKPKKGTNKIVYFLAWLDYSVFSFLERVDTKNLFRGRGIPTESGRVRSRAERRLANFFKNQGIDYEYESTLSLEGKEFSPDFYLPDYGVYVELWGLADSDKRYQKTMSLKKALYKKHLIPVISIYPRHLSNLPKVFPKLLEKITTNTCPRKEV